ncbi:MAG: phospholipid carrier-dependent glycosyltransferase [Rhodanobacteraceae bacterium]|nr:MAG: phospholipid carrier-dependent glycosyltransferase [Rhodanobacteraceae bacterium]
MSRDQPRKEEAAAGDVTPAAFWSDFDHWLIWVATFIVFTSVIGMAATLARHFHAPQVLLVSLLVTAVAGYAMRRKARSLPGARPRWRHVLLLLLVALIFRVPAYHYVMGGQDEGIYVNIAHYIERTGGIDVHDPVHEALTRTPYLAQYDAVNQIGGTSYLGGVYKGRVATGKLQFQFYDLFPVWMALFIGVFGSMAGVYASTFFALLSIVFFYRIALLLTANRHSALIAGALLALSPLHAFFSKFPVTEIPTLCFSLLGFLLLAAYGCDEPERRQRQWLWLSVLAFLCVFVTRISGFMYVPFMIGLAWAALLFDRDAQRRRHLQLWAVGITVVYVVSVAYGSVWSSYYSHDIYVSAFRPRLGKSWRAILAVLAIGTFAAWLVIGRRMRNRAMEGASRSRLLAVEGWLPAAVVYIALCVGLAKIYWLGWTRHYQYAHGYSAWHLMDTGWYGATATSLWSLAVFMGPLLVLAFFVSVAAAPRDPRIRFLRWFVAGFFTWIATLEWVLPYSPYYSRYLLSEVVPYSILLTVCVWSGLGRGQRRSVLSLVMTISLLYGLTLSAAQLGKNENQGARAALARVVRHVGPSDLILVDGSPGSLIGQSEVKTPLLYTFGRAAATVGPPGLCDAGYWDALGASFDQLFLLTSSRIAHPTGFQYVTGSRFRVMQFQWNHSFPHKLIVGRNYPLYLFRRDNDSPLRCDRVVFASGGMGVNWLRSGWSGQEPWGTWSLGKHAVMSIGGNAFAQFRGGAVLRLDAKVLVSAQHAVQHVIVKVNGTPVAAYTGSYPASELTMQIPIAAADIRGSQPVTVMFTLPDATSPAAIGIGADTRQLALGLIDARILPPTQPPGSAQRGR